jgi:dGTPase
LPDQNQRFVTESRRDFRTPAQVDRDRILYSTAFLRLAEVTQVVSAEKGYVFHNRLTHSLKVAQLSRRLAEKLNKDKSSGIDPDVAESAALAHDLGHPPFGHIAEDELDSVSREAGLVDGFNGNAQSFRIVTRLAVGDAVGAESNQPVRGLNLTRGTLDGILKYPWVHGDNSAETRKWGAFISERQVFRWARDGNVRGDHQKCLVAEIMDWCDDITYAVHDLIDFYRAGQIPLDRLADKNHATERRIFLDGVFERRPDLRPRRTDLETAFEGALEFFPIDRRYDGSLKQREGLWQFTTVLISKYVNAFRLVGSGSTEYVSAEPNASAEITMLKELTWHYVILNHELATLQDGQREIIRLVFDRLIKAAGDSRKWSIFPPEFREELANGSGDAQRMRRAVADFIASMTEREIKAVYHSLTGH